ncbi:hypothetical protein PMAYCL1PPCAC_24712, partial [Pristionchus mayeri]
SSSSSSSYSEQDRRNGQNSCVVRHPVGPILKSLSSLLTLDFDRRFYLPSDGEAEMRCPLICHSHSLRNDRPRRSRVKERGPRASPNCPYTHSQEVSID